MAKKSISQESNTSTLSLDPTGTTPGIAAQSVVRKKVFMACKKCSHNEAEELLNLENGQRLYRCVKCLEAWGINVGGAAGF